jgi:outer membrane immunogenic protein
MQNSKLFVSVAVAISAIVGISAASAADMAVKARPLPVPVPVYSWTGCYLGVEGGGNWGRTSTTAVSGTTSVGLPLTADYDLSGAIAGGTAGCNYQTGQFVFGIEGDVSWTDKRGTTFDIPPFNTTTTTSLRERWFDTIRGRVGWAWDKVLIYGTAGGAFAGTRTDVCDIRPVCVSDSQTRSGWTAGAGVEFAAWQNWSVKLEYLHADFGHKNYIDPPVTIGGGTFRTRSVGLTDDLVRVGVNYRFGWGSPVVAKY